MRPLVALIAAIALSPEAAACGGFFCSQEFPIDQAAEQIVFAVNEAEGQVTAHVGITYQGASEDFAWIVPTPGVPQLFVSSDALISAVSQATRPTFVLQHEYLGNCNGIGWGREYALSADDSDSAPPSAEEGGDGVNVIAQERVGPYDTVTLQARSSAELLDWLNENQYDLPSNLEPVLTPYIAQGQYFVALKLSAGEDAGDIAPLGMRYPGTAASVPIQLTSIAATPDMRLEVHVFGERRAVPENYLHVQINEAAISWFDGGQNYNEVITLAADEAGGHAFATDYSGTTANLRGTLWQGASQDAALDQLRSLNDPEQWLSGVFGLGLPPSAALLAVLQEAIPFPESLASQGVTPQNFYDCLGCYLEHVDTAGFSGEAATAILETKMVAGLREAEALFAAHPHMSRLTSSLDAVEMTVDPLFTFNADMEQEVSNVHTATVQYDCGIGTDGSWDADRRLILADGRRIHLPSQQWVYEEGTTEAELMSELAYPYAIVIERTGRAGAAEVLFDYREQAAGLARRFRANGGCDSGAPVGGLALALSVALAARRRRG
jgi:hypothetical protein